jgi:hypothetical protein
VQQRLGRAGLFEKRIARALAPDELRARALDPPDPNEDAAAALPSSA